ncbi:MAG: DUF805 domain-containing protein [Fibrobacter sp.]|nr:DUF805 domain-containing protein [Fibrobacter sp.]
MDYFLKALANYANGNGRATRKEYWMYSLFATLFLIILLAVDMLLIYHGISSYLANVYGLAICCPGIAITVRRAHDIGLSGWYWWLLLVPFVNFYIGFKLCFADSESRENKYGPDPKAFERVNSESSRSDDSEKKPGNYDEYEKNFQFDDDLKWAFEILGCEQDASDDEVDCAYFMKMKESHPDKLPKDSPEWIVDAAKERLKKIKEAYLKIQKARKN